MRKITDIEHHFMNKFKLFFAIVLCYGTAYAQQKPYYTQYILNNYILNPALSGIENYTDIKLSYRKQWTGIDGSPTTMYFSAQGALNKPDMRVASPTSFEVPGQSTGDGAYWNENEAPAPHHGIGIIAMNDKTGYISRSSVYGTYAYHKPLNTTTTLSLGFQLGVTNISLDRSKIVWGSLDPNDPAIGYDNGELKKLMPEVGAGLWLYSRNYFVGASVLNIVPGKAKFVSNDKYGTYLVPHYFITGGVRAMISNSMSVLPSVMIQAISPEPVLIHANVKLQYEDLLWIGGSYRIKDDLGGLAIMAGLNVGNTFNVGYAYDMPTKGALKQYTQNTHEIIIGFIIGNKYGDSCPKNVW